MMNYVKYFNSISLYTSIILVAIMTIGYLLGITIICGSLFILLRTTIMTGAKVVMYLVSNVYRLFIEIKMMSIMTEEGLIY